MYDVNSVRDTTWGKSGSPGGLSLSLLVIAETRVPESVFWPSCTHCHCSKNANHIIFGENKSLKAHSCFDTPWRSSLPTFAMSKVQIKFNYFSLENICLPNLACILSCRLWRNQITKRPIGHIKITKAFLNFNSLAVRSFERKKANDSPKPCIKCWKLYARFWIVYSCF